MPVIFRNHPQTKECGLPGVSERRLRVELPECYGNQNSGLKNGGDRFEYRKDRLPDCYGNQNRKWFIANSIEFGDDHRGGFGIPDPLLFGRVKRRKGIIKVVFPDEAKAIRARQRRWQEPQPPPIQLMVKHAYQLKMRLDSEPTLNRARLAREVGINPSYLTRLLNLLNLAPEIQEYIMALPPSRTKGPITESRLKSIARLSDYEVQLERFEEMKGRPVRQWDRSSVAAAK